MELLISDVRRQVAALDHAINRERDQSQRLLSDMRDDLRKARLERTVAESQILPLRESRDTWQALAVDRANTITQLQAETTRLRNQVPVASNPEPISQPDDDAPRDDTATRFALLELD